MANRVHCTNCDRGGHAAWQCTRPKKSTASRKDVNQVVGSDGFRKASDPSNAAGGKALIAGTQALPVDTNPAGAEAKFDKAAWMREHMPAYMRKYRAEVKAGTRVPKPRETKE